MNIKSLQKGIQRIGHGRRLSTFLRNVQRIHLSRVRLRHIRRIVCKKLYVNHITYDWVTPQKYVCEEVEESAIFESRFEYTDANDQ